MSILLSVSLFSGVLSNQGNFYPAFLKTGILLMHFKNSIISQFTFFRVPRYYLRPEYLYNNYFTDAFKSFITKIILLLVLRTTFQIICKVLLMQTIKYIWEMQENLNSFYSFAIFYLRVSICMIILLVMNLASLLQ